MLKALLALLTVGCVATLTACGGEEATPPSPADEGMPTAAPAANVTPARSPTPAPPSAGSGTPLPGSGGATFSLASLQKAWGAKGMQVAVGERNGGFSGFGAPALDVRLTRDKDAMDLSVLIYAGREEPAKDWESVVGKAPVPKAGRRLPDHVSAWWNENVIVVIRARSGAISADAQDAFLALTP